MPTSVINEILSFCPQGTIASGDIMALEDYKNDVQRLRGHQPGIARRELENMALRQSSFVAAGLAQFVAKRYAPGVRDDADLDALETAITAAITALIAAGNAQTATRLATKRTIGGVAFDGSANIHHYATCSTAAATAAKTVALAGFALATGARVLVKFTVTNSAANRPSTSTARARSPSSTVGPPSPPGRWPRTGPTNSSTPARSTSLSATWTRTRPIPSQRPPTTA